MKKIILSLTAVAMLFAAQPPLLIKGVKVGLHPLPVEVLSEESGGILKAEQAYSDGIGVMMVDPIGTEITDYSTLNDLVLKYGSEALAVGSHLRDYVLTNGSTKDKAKVKLLAMAYQNEDTCNDNGGIWTDGVCQGDETSSDETPDDETPDDETPPGIPGGGMLELPECGPNEFGYVSDWC